MGFKLPYKELTAQTKIQNNRISLPNYNKKNGRESWYNLKLFFITLSSCRVVKKTLIVCDLQVVSPITGQEIGMQEVRVAKNRETIRGMNVRILTGLGLDVQADPVQRGRYVLRTSYSQLLSSKYQVSAIVHNELSGFLFTSVSCAALNCEFQNYVFASDFFSWNRNIDL